MPPGTVGINLLHEYRVDGKGHVGALSEGHLVEMDGAVVPSDPYPGNQVGGDPDIPPVRMILGGPGFPAHLGFNAVDIPDPECLRH